MHMSVPQRTAPIVLSQQQFCDDVVLAEYRAGYGNYRVNSYLDGDEKLSDLWFEIIINELKKNSLKEPKT